MTERTEVPKDEKFNIGTIEPTGNSSEPCNGTQGQNGNCDPFVSIKNIKNYYFKGKYPKPK